MKYRCNLRTVEPQDDGLRVEAEDAYQAAIIAARRHRNEAFDAIEVWKDGVRLLTWIRPAQEEQRD